MQKVQVSWKKKSYSIPSIDEEFKSMCDSELSANEIKDALFSRKKLRDYLVNFIYTFAKLLCVLRMYQLKKDDGYNEGNI